MCPENKRINYCKCKSAMNKINILIAIEKYCCKRYYLN